MIIGFRFEVLLNTCRNDSRIGTVIGINKKVRPRLLIIRFTIMHQNEVLLDF
jgi:hypothetical protein